MKNGFDEINKKIKQDEVVITEEKILNDKAEKQKHVDAVTAPTMATLFANLGKKSLEQKEKSKE